MSIPNRFLLLFFFILINFNTSFSQVSLGFKAGLNLSKGEFKPYEDQSLNFIVRYHAGFLAEIAIYKRLFVQPEILYSNKGWNSAGSSNHKGIDMNLHYLNIPVLAGYRINKQFSVVAGPEFGYLLRAHQNPGGVVEDFYQKYDLGFSLGTVINFASRFGVSFRYTHGFKGLLRDVAITDPYGVSMYDISRVGSNRVLQISTRYRLKKF